MKRHWAMAVLSRYDHGKMDEKIKVEPEIMRVYHNQAYIFFKELAIQKD